MNTRKRKWTIVLVSSVLLVSTPFIIHYFLPKPQDSFYVLYLENCAVCHGDQLEGGAQGPALIGRELSNGHTVMELKRSISSGNPQRGMPGWSHVLSEADIASLAMLVAEKRQRFSLQDLKIGAEIELPDDPVNSRLHEFSVELFAQGIDPLPFSIAPLPEGGFLLTEKKRGLSIIYPDGEQSPLITGTPKAHGDSLRVGELEVGLGWMMEVALHPDYVDNGWVYLHYGDRCGKECGQAFLPVSMNRLDRGRIIQGEWRDAQTIWQADDEAYNSAPEIGAGGRIAFDDRGHVFIGIGVKTTQSEGIQNLDMPYGKIHRVNDDGSIPHDNPFVVSTDKPLGSTTRETVWSYGHRNPQGLEFNPSTGELWSSEHGPRGGDEINLIQPGGNYGWPLVSRGVDYDGTMIDYGTKLNIEFDLKDIEQPVVDLSPSPAVSSFVFYEGEAFPQWRHSMIVGSLKASTLYRIVVEDGKVVEKEVLLSGLARIRDVEVGADGLIYLLLENRQGGMIVRLTPESL